MKLRYILSALYYSGLIAAKNPKCKPVWIRTGDGCTVEKTDRKTTTHARCTNKGTFDIAISADKQLGKIKINNEDWGRRAFTAWFKVNDQRGNGQDAFLSYVLEAKQSCEDYIDASLKTLWGIYTTAPEQIIEIAPCGCPYQGRPGP